MNTNALAVIDINHQTKAINGLYANLPLTQVNDHVVRVSVMTEPFYWHMHPNSDETFLVVEGTVYIDLEDTTIELLPGQLFTIPKTIRHCTRPKGERSINLTFEREDMETVKVGAPEKG